MPSYALPINMRSAIQIDRIMLSNPVAWFCLELLGTPSPDPWDFPLWARGMAKGQGDVFRPTGETVTVVYLDTAIIGHRQAHAGPSRPVALFGGVAPCAESRRPAQIRIICGILLDTQPIGMYNIQ